MVFPKPSSPASSCSCWSSSSSSSSAIVLQRSSPSSMGDLIGTESGVYMSSNEEDLLPKKQPPPPPVLTGRRRRSSNSAGYAGINASAKKEYPPPIPSLARTENLPGRMPWVLTRQYTEDGRLIIRETKVPRHEYFHAHRQDGRLVLNLIHEDYDDDHDDDDNDNDDHVDDDDDDGDRDLQFVDDGRRGGEEETVVVVVVSEEDHGEIKSSVEDDDEDKDDDEDGNEQKRREERKLGKFMFPKFSSTYASGAFMDSKKYSLDVKNSYLDRSSSSSSSLPFRPMAAAM